MRHSRRWSATLALSLGMTGLLLQGCRLFTEFPTFDLNRPERVGEPFTVVPSESKSVYILDLGARRRVQAMPIYMVKRDLEAIHWKNLADHVRVPPSKRNSGYVDDLREIFIVSPNRADSLPPTKHVEVKSPLEALGTGDPRPELRERQERFLRQLDDPPGEEQPFLATTVVLVCVPPAVKPEGPDRNNQCFQPGKQYDITVRIPGYPETVAPFRVEKHNDVFGAGLGFLLTLFFVGFNVS